MKQQRAMVLRHSATTDYSKPKPDMLGMNVAKPARDT